MLMIFSHIFFGMQGKFFRILNAWMTLKKYQIFDSQLTGIPKLEQLIGKLFSIQDLQIREKLIMQWKDLRPQRVEFIVDH